MNKFIFIIFCLLVSGFSVFGQNSLEKDLNKSFKNYDLVELNDKEVLEKVRTKQPVEVQAYGRYFQFVLTPNDIRAKNYRAIETAVSGERELAREEKITTFKGNLTDDATSEVRFTVSEGNLEGVIYTGDDQKFFIAKASKFSRFAQKSAAVVYGEDDLLKTVDLSDDVKLLPDDIQSKMDYGFGILDSEASSSAAAPEMNAATAADYKELEVATEADYQWVTQAGGAAAANNEILGILNLVDGIYKRDLNLTVKVTFQHVWTGTDPYPTGSSVDILNAFLSHWNANYPALQNPRDTAHLFTGKITNQGIAYTGVICSSPSYAYGLTGRSGSVNHLIAAHEIGHNLSAEHVDNSGTCASSIMNPVISFSATTFCATSKTQISNFTAARTCLSSTTTAPACTYSINAGSQNFSASGGTGSVTVTTQSGCGWTATANQSFISINSGNSGSSSGTVIFSVASNSGAARSGTITVAGQTFTVNQAAAVPSLYNLSGSIIFGNTPSGQPLRYVPGVNLILSGTSFQSVLTDEYGSYLLQGLSGVGTYTVTPSKAPDVSAVSSFDASLASRYAAGLVALTPNQALAADVSGNGSVSSYDAALIAKTAGNIGNEGIAGRWKFTPTSRSYANLTNHQSNQNYEAVLMGDVSGNWTAQNSALASAAYLSEEERSAADKAEEAEFRDHQALTDAAFADQNQNAAAPAATQAGTTATAAAGVVGITVDIPDNLTAANGSTVLVPINVGDVTGQGIISYSFTLSFNQNVLQLAQNPFETSGTLSSGLNITPNTETAGQINIQAFGTANLSGSGTLFFLRFNVVGAAGTSSNLSLNTFMFNEGTPQSMATGGAFTVAAAPPTAATVTVAGRVTTAQGRGIGNVSITLTDAGGNRRTAVSTAFGYYRFDNIGAGETVTLTARSKRYEFNQSTIVRTTNESVSDADFVSRQ